MGDPELLTTSPLLAVVHGWPSSLGDRGLVLPVIPPVPPALGAGATWLAGERLRVLGRFKPLTSMNNLQPR